MKRKIKFLIAAAIILVAVVFPWGEIVGSDSGAELTETADAAARVFDVRHTETKKIGKANVTIAIVRDTERGVGTEYVVVTSDKGGVSITPRVGPDGKPYVTSQITGD